MTTLTQKRGTPKIDRRLTFGLSNLFVLLPLIWASSGVRLSADYYVQHVQEDGAIEWMTVWALLAAALVFARVAREDHQDRGRRPWFLIMVSLSCLFIALEEISWGLGFLSHSSAELNLHGLIGTSITSAVFEMVILGFGVVLPLLWLVPANRVWMRRQGVAPGPFGLVPAFLAAFAVNWFQPWPLAGEVSELMFAMALLLSAVWRRGRSNRWAYTKDSPLFRPVLPAAATLVLFFLGAASTQALGPTRHYDDVDLFVEVTKTPRRDMAQLQ